VLRTLAGRRDLASAAEPAAHPAATPCPNGRPAAGARMAAATRA